MIPIVLVLIILFVIFSNVSKDARPELITHDELVEKGKLLQSSIRGLCDKYGFEPAMIVAQCIVESSLDPSVIGDGGKSRGIMQIQKLAWENSTLEINKTHYTYDSMWNNMYTNIEVGIGYHKYNARKSGITSDGDFLLRAYNGGLSGANSLGAKNYATKVWAYYHKLKGEA